MQAELHWGTGESSYRDVTLMPCILTRASASTSYAAIDSASNVLNVASISEYCKHSKSMILAEFPDAVAYIKKMRYFKARQLPIKCFYIILCCLVHYNASLLWLCEGIKWSETATQKQSSRKTYIANHGCANVQSSIETSSPSTVAACRRTSRPHRPCDHSHEAAKRRHRTRQADPWRLYSSCETKRFRLNGLGQFEEDAPRCHSTGKACAL